MASRTLPLSPAADRWLYGSVLAAILVAVAAGAAMGRGASGLNAMLLVAPVAAIGLVAGLRRPEWLFYALIGLVFLLGVVDPAALSESFLSFGVGGLLVLSLALRWATRRQIIVVEGQSALWAILFAGWAILPALLSPQFGLVRIYWLVVVLFLLTPTFIQTSDQLRWFAWVVVIGSLLASVVALWQQGAILVQLGTLDPVAIYRGVNRETLLDSGGVLSTRLIKAIPFVMVLLPSVRGQVRSRAILFATLGLVLLVTVLTFSNNGYLGIAFTFLLLAFLLPRRRDRVVAIVVLVAGYMLVSAFSLDDRVTAQIDVIASGENYLLWGSDRGLKFYMAWQSILASPWLGYGPAQAGTVLPNFVPLEFLRRGSNSEFAVPHNMLLSLWVDLGALGVVFFLGLYGSICIRLWQAVKRIGRNGRSLDEMIGYGILIALIVYFVQGMLISIHTEKLMWMLMGSGAAYIRLAGQDAFSAAMMHKDAGAHVS